MPAAASHTRCHVAVQLGSWGLSRSIRSLGRTGSRRVRAQQPSGAALAAPPTAGAELLAGAERLLQTGSQRLQTAVDGLQLPSMSGLQLPTDVDAQQAAGTAGQASVQHLGLCWVAVPLPW